MAFHEDRSRVRTGNADQNLAVVRHMAVNMLKQETTAKVGIKAKRKKAGWDYEYLLKVLSTSNAIALPADTRSPTSRGANACPWRRLRPDIPIDARERLCYSLRMKSTSLAIGEPVPDSSECARLPSVLASGTPQNRSRHRGP